MTRRQRRAQVLFHLPASRPDHLRITTVQQFQQGVEHFGAKSQLGQLAGDVAAAANDNIGSLPPRVVIGKVGTQPVLDSELKQAFWGKTVDGVNKIVSKNQARDMIAEWRRNGQRIVFTNGCFDILHIGHITLLHTAADQGDKLIVGLNSDRSVAVIKGPRRPIVPAEQRAEILSGLNCIDFITLFDEPDPFNLIRLIRPDVLVKGGDWPEDQIIGADIVKADGGKVVRVPLIKGNSTTAIIEKILKNYA